MWLQPLRQICFLTLKNIREGHVGVLGNGGTCQRTIGGQGTNKICKGNKGTISLPSGNREHCKRLRKIKFLHRKVGLNVSFCTIC